MESSFLLNIHETPAKEYGNLPLWKRITFLIWSVLECFLFGGITTGWASLAYVLISEGIYLDLCDVKFPSDGHGFNGNQTEILSDDFPYDVYCEPQEARFDLAFSIASGCFCFFAFINGQITFHLGTRVARIIATILFLSGSLLIAFESKELPWLVFPGLTLVGVGGIPLLVTSTQVANFFPKHSAAVIGLLNGAFDASAGVLLIIKIAFDNGVSRRDSFLFLAALNVTVLASTFIIYPRWFIKIRKPKKPSAPSTDDEVNANETELSIEASQSETNIRGSILSPLFMLHLVWFCLLFLHFTYFVSSLNPWLNNVLDRDREKVSYYTNVHLYSLLPAIVVAWLAGLVYDGVKRCYRDDNYPLRGKIRASVFPLSMTSLSAVMVSLLMQCENENVLYVTFLMVMVFRAFLYSTATSFLLLVFPLEQFGILYSTSLIFGGALAFCQYALFTWSQESGFSTVNGFMAGLAGFTLIHPVCQYISTTRASRAKKYYEKI